MARDQVQQEKKKAAIVEFYNKLDAIKEFGVKKHTTAWCLAKTAEAFFLQPRTIEYYIYSKN